MIDILGTHWAGFGRIIYAPLLLIVLYIIIYRYYQVKKSIKFLVQKSYQKILLKHFSLHKHAIKSALLCVGMVSLFIALLQPQWGKKEQVIVQEGRDLLVLLDISRSMCARDIKPTRLDFAKLKIRHLLSKLPTERIGLIVFSGSAFVQCPLTADHAAFVMFLDQVDTELISSGTTSLDKALARALEVFGSSDGRKNKLAVILTDGEDFSLNLNAIQQKAITDQLNLFALGIGTLEGAPIPKFDDAGNQIGHEVDDRGNVALSALNEETLQSLCAQLHGIYYRAHYDDSDIDNLVTRIMQYEKETFNDKKLSLFHDQYPWLLAVTWICLALEWIL